MNTSRPIQQAAILAAGAGRRLDHTGLPKPLVQVGNTPLIIHALLRLQEAGVTRVTIVLGHRGEEIRKELTGHPLIFAELDFVEQSDSDEKGMLQSVLILQEHVRGPFYLAMADVVFDAQPYHLFSSFVEREADGEKVATLVSTDAEQGARSGANSRVYLSENGSISDLGRELSKWNGLEVGVYAFGARALSCISSLFSPSVQSFEDLLRELNRAQLLEPVQLKDGEWFDVNDPATHVRADMAWRRRTREAVVCAPDETPLTPVRPFASFHRHRILESRVILERGIIDTLSSREIIPLRYKDATHFLITDDIVDSLYGEKVREGLCEAGYDVRKLVVPAGEQSKGPTEYLRLADEMFSLGLTKHSHIISLGGGVVNNIAGVLAATIYRGINLIHFPTTSMAQMDAAIDFKQAINSTKGKNLLGAYYPATSIIIDPNFLSTLDPRHIRNGLSEAAKHALVHGPDFYDFLLKNAKRAEDTDYLEEVIRLAIELKIPLLNGDTSDDYNEMLPQYGHSVGHAVEHLSAYDLLHGEAVAIGACVSAEVSRLLRICSDEVVEAHYGIFEAYKLPTTVPKNMTASDVCEAIRYDKHFASGRPHMALPEAVGRMFNDRGTYSIPVEYELVRQAIERNQARATAQ